MTSLPTDIVPSGLAAHLQETYGLAITTIVSVPKGEDAGAYCATSREGARYFVRVEHGRTDDRLEVALAASAALRDEGNFSCIVAPLPTKQGAATSRLAALTVAVFPFVEGKTANDQAFNESDWRRLAAIMAALHGSELRGIQELPRETFANPFAATVRHALERAASVEVWSSSFQEQTAALLLANRADLNAVLTKFERLGEEIRRRSPDQMVTHGDPNLSNVLLDDAGELQLIDWGWLGLGPRERDLMAITGDRFASFLDAYLANAGPVWLSLDLFTFYFLRWVLQEIADYSSRLLLAPRDAEAQAHAWRELQPYLPIPHATIAADCDAVQRTIAPFVRAGLVQLGPNLV